MSEIDLMHRIQIRASEKGMRLLRNNVGMYRKGKRVIRYGLGKGSSDLIGLTPVIITPEMVGRRIAVFTAYEVKLPGKKPTKQQGLFLCMVIGMGGFGKVIENEEEVGPPKNS